MTPLQFYLLIRYRIGTMPYTRGSKGMSRKRLKIEENFVQKDNDVVFSPESMSTRNSKFKYSLISSYIAK